MKMDMEMVVFNLISYSRDAKKACMEAIDYSRKGDFEKANLCMMEATEKLSEAHIIQTELIHKEAQGEKTELSFVLIHAEDCLMNAATIKELAEEMIKIYKEIKA